MATAGLPLWSTTAASNATADPAANWPEGMAPSAVNDSARATMASVAKWRDDFYGVTSGLSTGGTSTAYTVTTNSTYATAAAMSGAVFTIIPHATSGAAPTLAVDGLTARALNVSTGVAVPTGALISGTPYFVRYKHASTEFIVIGPSILPVSFVDILGATAKTSAASTDRLLMYDVAGTANKYITRDNFFASLTLAGAQMGAGSIYNATITETNTTNAVTFAVKTLAGADPSSTDPVLFAFRSATVGSGAYVYRTLTSALSLTISSGSTLGFTSGIAGRLWLVVFDDGGTLRLGVVNCLNGINIFPLGQNPISSSVAEGGAGAADLPHAIYTGTAVTSKAYVVLGYADYESGVATAGAWNVSPTRIRLFNNSVPLPGAVIQTQRTQSGAVSTGTTVIPVDDTIPQISEGISVLSQAITASSKANVLAVTGQVVQTNASVVNMALALFNTDYHSTNAMASVVDYITSASQPAVTRLDYWLQALVTTSSTFALRGGAGSAGTTTFNGSAGSRLHGGVLNSSLAVSEIMA